MSKQHVVKLVSDATRRILDGASVGNSGRPSRRDRAEPRHSAPRGGEPPSRAARAASRRRRFATLRFRFFRRRRQRAASRPSRVRAEPPAEVRRGDRRPREVDRCARSNSRGACFRCNLSHFAALQDDRVEIEFSTIQPFVDSTRRGALLRALLGYRLVTPDMYSDVQTSVAPTQRVLRSAEAQKRADRDVSSCPEFVHVSRAEKVADDLREFMRRRVPKLCAIFSSGSYDHEGQYRASFSDVDFQSIAPTKCMCAARRTSSPRSPIRIHLVEALDWVAHASARVEA